MEYALVLIVNFIGTAIVTAHQKTNESVSKGQRMSWMGIWPYNIVLLAGIVSLVITGLLEIEHWLIASTVVGATVIFYIFKLRNEPK